jgi:galactose oxidase
LWFLFFALMFTSGDTGRAQSLVPVDRTGWTVTADSENLQPGYPATYAIDGNAATLWHTAWTNGIAPLPHWLTIDMHREAEIHGLAYLPRTDGDGNGRIGRYEIRVSPDGSAWSAPVAAGTWPDTAGEKTAAFAPVRTRVVRLSALSEAGYRAGWTSAVEVNLLAPDPRSTWTVTASCEETTLANGAVTNAFDSNPATSWLTRSSGTPCAYPHAVTMDLSDARTIAGLSYLPRQDGSANGRIGTYGIDVSSDGGTWTNVAAGAFTDNAAEKTVPFAPRTVRFVRLRALSEAGNRGPWAGAAEIKLVEGDGPGTTPSSRATIGEWSQTIGFPLVPVAAAVLPTNKLLTWSSYTTHASGGTGKTVTATLDLATGVVSQRTVTETGHDMFCPGTSLLADGTVFVTGGDDASETSAYQPFTDTWIKKPDMNIARGYQATTTLSDGGVFVIGGGYTGGWGGKDGEVWTEATGWQRRPGAAVDAILTDDPEGLFRSDNHAWLFALANGRVFHAGPSVQMNYFETTGDGAVFPAGRRGDADAMNGNAVMYDINKILAVGGSPAYIKSTATNKAYVIEIDPTARTASTRPVTSMALPRAFHNSVALPDGKVLVVGGQQHPVAFSDVESVMEAELWDPATERFTTMARMTVPRNYHSVALLLPDGRVFAGGGGLCGNCAANHADGELFSPPYLFGPDGSLATRPAIQSAPATASRGQRLTVTTDRPVTTFSLVRMASVTHSVNNDQRRIPLVSTSGNGLQHEVVVPADSNVVLPGVYFLFALDAHGVPSVARLVTIGTAEAPASYNIAREGTASQSSTGYGGIASRAIDGLTDGTYDHASVSHTNGTWQPWWQVDLGSVRTLETLTLWNRIDDCCADRLRDVRVFVSETPFLYPDVERTRTQAGVRELSMPGARPQRSTVTLGGRGRYVRVQLTYTTFLSLAEVEIMGR